MLIEIETNAFCPSQKKKDENLLVILSVRGEGGYVGHEVKPKKNTRRLLRNRDQFLVCLCDIHGFDVSDL